MVSDSVVSARSSVDDAAHLPSDVVEKADISVEDDNSVAAAVARTIRKDLILLLLSFSSVWCLDFGVGSYFEIGLVSISQFFL